MADLPVHNPQRTIPAEADEDVSDQDILNTLDSYRREAEEARKSGPSPRDTVWKANWERYWGKYDFTDKEKWQSRYVMPEAPQYVDRWAAAMREALDAGGEWFEIEDELGTNAELIPHIKKLMKIMLGRCMFTPDGHTADFSAVFEEQMKMGAIMMLCAAVTWRDSEDGGWLNIATVDPREVWADPKLRNLYRLRRYEIDKYELEALANELDDAGEPLYDVEAIRELLATPESEEVKEKETSGGHGTGGDATKRTPIEIEEWLATVVDADGAPVHSNALMIVANRTKIIRRPEKNPFWHNHDWLVSTPMIPVPFSAYGRTYMEDWADVADAFVEMTNLILDGVLTSTLKAFAAVPEMLQNPAELTEGISPNHIFQLTDGITDVKSFIKEIELGTLPPESIAVWQALKQELRDGAKLSEIALGQMPPKGEITATEITAVAQSGSAMIRSMARTIESRFLEIVLTLSWQTTLQHLDFTKLQGQFSDEAIQMFQTRREEFRDLKVKFRVRGISGAVDRQSQLRNLLALLQIIGQNELMLQALLQDTSVSKIVGKLFTLFGIDVNELKLSPTEQAIAQLTQAQAPQAPAQ